MAFGSDPIKTEYQNQYFWTPFGLFKKSQEEKQITVPLAAQKEIKTGDASRFTFLKTTVTNNSERPNTVFTQAQNANPTTKTAETNVSQSTNLDEINKTAQTKMKEAEDKFNQTNEAIEEKFVKNGESVDERLARYYTKYKNATPEEKEKFLERYITGHYATLTDKSKAEQISLQLTDYKKLLTNTTNLDSYEMLAKRINILEKENQVLAAKSATVEQTNLNLRYRGEIGVAKTIHNCDTGNQIELTQLVVDSKNFDAINIGASYASELNKTNQVGAIDIYKTADISQEDKIKLGQTIIDQYSKFDVNNQVDIHSIMSDKNFWDTKTITSAASNIYNLNKINQEQAIKITADTKIESAINAAQANLNKCDESVRQTGAQTLTKAKEEIQNTKTNEKSTINNSEDKTEKVSTSEQIKEAIKSKTPDSAVNTKNLIKSAPDSVIMNLLNTLSGSDLKNFIKILVQSSPSMDVLSKTMALSKKLSPADQKEIMVYMKDLNMLKLVEPKTLDYASQNTFIDLKAKEGNLAQIESNNLCPALREKYFKIKNEQDTKQGNEIGKQVG